MMMSRRCVVNTTIISLALWTLLIWAGLALFGG